MATSDEHFIRLALEEADKAGREGNQAVGSVILWQGEVVARGRNLVVSKGDPTAHAETVALREAAGNLRRTDLTGCTLYTTFEPCPMCLGAILVSGITRLVIGAEGRGSVPWGQYSVERLLSFTERTAQLEVAKGILASECLDVRRTWEGSSKWFQERLAGQEGLS